MTPLSNSSPSFYTNDYITLFHHLLRPPSFLSCDSSTMKLLGWMHRKLTHNGGIEALKNSTIGNLSSCFSVQTLFDEHSYYLERTNAMSHSKNIHRKSSNGFGGAEVGPLHKEELFEPFDFLSIGTFGYEFITEPPTPTLPVSIEKMTGQGIEVITESDLNLMNYELEKFLEAEEAEAYNDYSSQRTSQASIITLSYKPIEGEDSVDGHMHMVACPLQNYLLAASIELAETEDKDVTKERTSLAELFKRNNVSHDDPPKKKCELGSDKQAKKRNVADFMKKVAKKFHCSSSNCAVIAPDKDTAASNPIKKKLSKSLVKMFSKKVYPEEMNEKRLLKVAKGKKIKSISCTEDDRHIGDNKFDQISDNKKDTVELSWIGICKGDSPASSGHWIKTDSDYLVLEL